LNFNWVFVWTKTAQKAYSKYPQKHLFQGILKVLNEDPFHGPNIKPLTGDWAGFYRYRKGDFRLIYKIDKGKHEITLVAYASRGSVY